MTAAYPYWIACCLLIGAFLGGAGRSLQADVSGGVDQNLVAYANLAGDKTVFVTVINKAHGVGATNVTVQIQLDTPLSGKNAKVIFLTESNSDIAAGASQMTLGGAPIRADGSWRGQWTTLPVVAGANVAALTMPPASAAVVKMKIK